MMDKVSALPNFGWLQRSVPPFWKARFTLRFASAHFGLALALGMALLAPALAQSPLDFQKGGAGGEVNNNAYPPIPGGTLGNNGQDGVQGNVPPLFPIRAGQGGSGGGAGATTGGTGGGGGIVGGNLPDTAAGQNGVAGTGTNSPSGGGGGGGGTNAQTTNSPVTISSTLTGGNGQAGGNGGDAEQGGAVAYPDGGGGGGGGEGGYGLIISGGSGQSSNSSSITGGDGGAGGSGGLRSAPISGMAGASGGGGAGGVGVWFMPAASGATFVNNGGTITGGNGGHSGCCNFSQIALLSANGGLKAEGAGGIAFYGILTSNSGTIQGGNAGTGAQTNGNGGVAGAGGGGVGAWLLNTVTGLNNTGIIAGGTGAAQTMPLAGSLNGWAGGDGGAGIIAAGTTITNSGNGTTTGVIQGGTGGNASGTQVQSGFGGDGINGANLVVINSGAINAGVGGVGTIGAFGGIAGNAITFTGGTNRLELQAGYSFLYNVDGTQAVTAGGTNTLTLGGAADASFDTSFLGSNINFPFGTTNYLGFTVFQMTGSGTWTLTGTPVQASTPWTIYNGILTMASASPLGAGGLTFDTQ